MNHSTASASLAERFEPRSETDTRLYGYWLVLVRLVCLTLCVLSVGLYVASVLSYIANHYCTGTAAACHPYGPIVVRTIQGPGLGIYTIVRDSIFALGYWLVAAFLFWRKSDDRVALLAAVTLGTFPIVFNNGFISTLSSPWWFPAHSMSFLGFLCFSLFFYVFPSGHFVPSWMRWVFVVALVYGVFNTFFPFASFNPFSLSPVLSDLIFIGLIVSNVLVQIDRYGQVSSPTHLQ